MLSLLQLQHFCNVYTPNTTLKYSIFSLKLNVLCCLKCFRDYAQYLSNIVIQQNLSLKKMTKIILKISCRTVLIHLSCFSPLKIANTLFYKAVKCTVT